MADRHTIESTFLTEVENAVSGSVPSQDVRLADEGDATVPMVTYRSFHRRERTNTSAPKPIRFVRDDNGAVVNHVYPTYHTIRFDVGIDAEDDDQRDSIYESIVDAFAPYEMPFKDASDFHQHAERVRFEDRRDGVNTNTEDPIREGNLRVFVMYYREHFRLASDGTPMEEFHVEVDPDTSDNTAGEQYTF